MAPYALYSASLFCLALALGEVWRAARALDLPAPLAVFVSAGLLLYLSALLPGCLGWLTTAPVTLTLSSLSLLLHFHLRRSVAEPPGSDPPGPPRTRRTLGPWTPAAAALLALGLWQSEPLWDYLSRLPARASSPNTPLPWDTVSYHLPALVEFVQTRTLWSMEGPFQSYSFGFELIAALPAVCFRTHAGVLAAHTYAILFLLCAQSLLVGQFARALRAPSTPKGAQALAAGAWCYIFGLDLKNYGKNDIFLTACLLAALSLLCDHCAARPTEHHHARAARGALLSAALGLALATKPPAIAYLPYFAFALVVAPAPGRALARVRAAFAVVSGAAAIGGFFCFRNLLLLGNLADPQLMSHGERLSILFNLTNPQLYARTRGAALYLASVALAAILLLLRPRLSRVSEASRALVGPALGFYAAAIAVYTATPMTVFHEDRVHARWEVRFAMPLHTLSTVFAAVAASALAERVARRRGLTLEATVAAPGRRLRRVGLYVGALTLAGLAGLWMARWQRRPLLGLPGYVVTKGLPPSSVYAWIRARPRPLRVYSAGLRPYGLYGDRWQNRVFYDLHSDRLDDSRAERSRLVGILGQFRPDLVALSVDPHGYTSGPTKPPLVAWMRQQACFVEVFSDETASVFEVREGWAALPDAPAAPSGCRMRP